MPFSSQNPLLNLEVKSMHCIDTENTINLHGLWSIFSRCANTLEDGKRLENLSWRIYSRETFCCAPDHQTTINSSSLPIFSQRSPDSSLPTLSRSVESTISMDSELDCPNACDIPSTRPPMHRFSSTDTQGRKHITPTDLENMVKSVKENQELEPLSPLPSSLTLSPPKSEPRPEVSVQYQKSPSKPTQQLQSSQPISAAARAPESSTSTMATRADSEASDISPRVATADSPCTEISSTSIVRGFSKDQISRSNRSRVQLAPLPQPILKVSPLTTGPPPAKKKGATFVLGGSSGEGDESSFESRYTRSSLADGLRRSNKTTSFKDEIVSRTIQDKMYESEEAIDDSDDMSESAIEDDDEDWEDDNEQSQAPTEEDMFQRVESSTNLTSRRSLISTMMHEKDRASALQNAASRSSPALRRSRTASHNGPLGASPKEQVQLSRARPIIMTTSNTHDTPALSPRTNRRNMLSTELTGSLRKHLLWERQHKTPGAKALKNRQYKSEIRLTEHTAGPFLGSGNDEALRRNESLNYFDTGLQEYHEKGW